MVTGLFPNTLYHLRVTAGDDKGYNDQAAASISVVTYIPRTFPVLVLSAR